jgi:AraC-like DNA-binding protein
VFEVMPLTDVAIESKPNTHKPQRSLVRVPDAQVHEFLERAYDVKLRLSRTDPVQREPALTHARTDIGSFAIDDVDLVGALTGEADPLDKVIVAWATHGRVASQSDGLSVEASVGDIAVLAQPGRAHVAHSRDLRIISVMMEPSLLASVAVGVPDRQAFTPVRFSSLHPVDAAAEQLWRRTVGYVKNEVLADDTKATPLVLGQAGRLLAAVTLSTFPNTATAEAQPHDRTDHHPVLLRRAVEYMESNAANDIAIADVADAIHVTPRAVQYMFRRHLDTTPLQYLRRLRLHYAHQDLVAGDRSSDTVTTIAARWGFMHTGRFAVMYRQTYGRSPHSTLRG